ncbi:Carnosine synthase 1 [Perkinsus chesapeaki]|uniref:Carnosine synthase 1 n=1 Tax=Perkinsus chesapeaki TaxID=330153 RepID=A0A7J6N1S4_PERCH|nr:Carnosine synthase 1 [Perkinsus chesapeaki]
MSVPSIHAPHATHLPALGSQALLGHDAEVDSDDDLHASTHSAQLRRLSLLRNANVVFFGAGNRGKQHVYERAAELGVNVIIVDEPNSWVGDLLQAGLIKQYIPLDINTHDHDQLHREAVIALTELKRIDAICTIWETSVLPTARLCEEFGLPGPTVAAVQLARDKKKTRDTIEASGLPATRHQLVTSETDLEEASRIVGFPAVLKPVGGGASMGVHRVDSYDELVQTFIDTSATLAEMVLVNGIFERKKEDPNHTVEFGSFMLEEYLDGAEVDINIIMSNGIATYVCVHDNGPTLEPHFNETWDIFPSTLPTEQVAALEDLAVNSVLAMGFTMGVFHVEAKYTSRGPRLIEVNARMGGGPLRIQQKVATGVDLVDELLLISLGLPSAPFLLPVEERNAVVCLSVNALKSGTISDLSFTKQWDSIDGVTVLSNTLLIKEGQHLVGPEEGLPTWLADIIFRIPLSQTDDVKALAEHLNEVITEEFLNHYDSR